MAPRITQLKEEVVTPPVQGPILYVATPAYGCMVTAQYTQCILQTQVALASVNCGMVLDTIGNESLITRARNILTKRFLMSNATHLLFIDADISWEPRAILRLLEKNEGVVTSCYAKKYLDWSKIEARVKQGGNEPIEQVGLDYNLNVQEQSVQVTNGFLEVLDAATGFMLVKREVLEQMYAHYEKELFAVNDLLGSNNTIKDYIAVFDCMIDPQSRRPLSEDYAFSRRWQKLGGRVYMDVLTPLAHTGAYAYEGNIAARIAAKQPTCVRPPQPNTSQQQIDSQGQQSVLLAILPTDDGKISVSCVSAITQVTGALQQQQNMRVYINMFSNKNDACDYAFNQKFDTILIIDGLLAFDKDLVLDMMQSPSPFHVGVYPTCQGIDWSRMADIQNTEDVRTRGYDYQVELVDSDQAEATTAPVGLAKIDRCVLQRIAERLDPRATYSDGQRRLWFHEGVMDDRKMEGDEMFCRLWGAGITVNTKYPVTKLGTMSFSGCILARNRIR